MIELYGPCASNSGMLPLIYFTDMITPTFWLDFAQNERIYQYIFDPTLIDPIIFSPDYQVYTYSSKINATFGGVLGSALYEIKVFKCPDADCTECLSFNENA